jgi:Domain of unknown function (DUF4399)
MIPHHRFFVLTFAASIAFLGGCSKPGPAHASHPEQDGVYIISPRNGEVVTSPVTVQFGLKGRGVAPAGVNQANTGHHHLLVDVDTLPPLNAPIPANDNHIHFGGGQTQTVVTLKPGQHTLQLLLGDHLHIPHNPPWMSEKITITVK